jgi:REP-associated tyrosine transposase
MPRRPRLNLANAPLHIIQRGNNRQACFFAEEDYRFYLYWLKKGAGKYGCDIHAYVLMTNHVHLLLTPGGKTSASGLMQSLGRRYVQYVNRIYKRSGTLWEGRYKASLVNAEEYLLLCQRYIELNPVRAGMVKDPGAYPWSSYGWHGLGERDELIRDHTLYWALGIIASERQQAYRELFKVQMDEEALTQIRKAASRELVLGNERFRQEIEEALGRRVAPQKRGRRKSVDGIEGEQIGLDFDQR